MTYAQLKSLGRRLPIWRQLFTWHRPAFGGPALPLLFSLSSARASVASPALQRTAQKQRGLPMNAGDRTPTVSDKDEKKNRCHLHGCCRGSQSQEGIGNQGVAAQSTATISDGRFLDRAGALVAKSLREQDALLDAFRKDLRRLPACGEGEYECCTLNSPKEHDRVEDGAERILRAKSVPPSDWRTVPSPQGVEACGGAASLGCSPKVRFPRATGGVEARRLSGVVERGCRTEGCVQND